MALQSIELILDHHESHRKRLKKETPGQAITRHHAHKGWACSFPFCFFAPGRSRDGYLVAATISAKMDTLLMPARPRSTVTASNPAKDIEELKAWRKLSIPSGHSHVLEDGWP